MPLAPRKAIGVCGGLESVKAKPAPYKIFATAYAKLIQNVLFKEKMPGAVVVLNLKLQCTSSILGPASLIQMAESVTSESLGIHDLLGAQFDLMEDVWRALLNYSCEVVTPASVLATDSAGGGDLASKQAVHKLVNDIAVIMLDGCVDIDAGSAQNLANLASVLACAPISNTSGTIASEAIQKCCERYDQNKQAYFYRLLETHELEAMVLKDAHQAKDNAHAVAKRNSKIQEALTFAQPWLTGIGQDWATFDTDALVSKHLPTCLASPGCCNAQETNLLGTYQSLLSVLTNQALSAEHIPYFTFYGV